MLLFVLILLLVFLYFVERELDHQDEQSTLIPEVCHKCKAEVGSDLLLCPGCSSLLREHCPSCGESKAISHRHCPWCGVVNEMRSHYAM